MGLAWLIWLEATLGRVVHAAWQGALLALIVLALTCGLGSHLRANWRFALWLVVFARLTTPWIPAAPWSIFACVPNLERPDAASELTAALPAIRSTTSTTDSIVLHTNGPQTPNSPAVAEGSDHLNTLAHEASALAPERGWWFAKVSLPQWLAFGWIAGAAVFGARMVWLNILLCRRRGEWKKASHRAL